MMGIEEKVSPSSVWQIESMRLSVLYPNTTGWEPPAIWKSITEQDPQEQRRQPRLRTIYEEGEWKTGKLVTISTDMRTDLIYAAIEPSPELSVLQLASLGNFDEAMESFGPAIKKWLPFAPTSVQRIAVGVVFLQQVSERLYAYEKISDYLHFLKIDAQGSRDLLYRINRPRPYSEKINGQTVNINRMSTWQAVHKLVVKLVMEGQSSTTSRGEPKEHAIRLETDINTVPDFTGPFSESQISDIAHLQFSWAAELCERGDVA